MCHHFDMALHHKDFQRLKIKDGCIYIINNESFSMTLQLSPFSIRLSNVGQNDVKSKFLFCNPADNCILNTSNDFTTEITHMHFCINTYHIRFRICFPCMQIPYSLQTINFVLKVLSFYIIIPVLVYILYFKSDILHE